MKKLWLSIVVIFVAIGLVGGAAYALLNNKGQVKGLTIETGEPDLKIGSSDWTGDDCSGDGEGGIICDAINNYGLIGKMYPGYLTGKYLRLKNNSDVDIGFDVTATLSKYANTSGYSGSWTALKNNVQLRFVEYKTKTDALWAESNTDFNSTKVSKWNEWKHLEWWSNHSPTITSQTIGQGNDRHFVLWVRVLESAGNEIVNKSLDLELELDGSQKN